MLEAISWVSVAVLSVGSVAIFIWAIVDLAVNGRSEQAKQQD